ncbi:MAG: 6-carboxytetrahydropterin synthase [Candidatus Delongbacteria bacterium]|nr:6-carboxytetrahydropterin synthase [Candidatus Delongbacteria bacterium]
MIYLTRVEEFSAAHRLHLPDQDEAGNAELFGECSNPRGHGHNYKLEVTIRGAIPPDTGMLLDLKRMGEIIDRVIIRQVDHKHLNFDVPFLAGKNPTAENLAVAFWNLLADQFPGAQLHELRIFETERSYITYRGEA